jgi:hypothetical protein
MGRQVFWICEDCGREYLYDPEIIPSELERHRGGLVVRCSVDGKPILCRCGGEQQLHQFRPVEYAGTPSPPPHTQPG